MISKIKMSMHGALRWSERYTKADMVYLARGNFWLTAGRAISIGTGFILTIAFANFISPQVFGTYKYVLAIAAFIGAFALGGLGAAVARAIVQGNKNVVPGIFRTAVLWSLPASGAAAIGSLYYFSNGDINLGAGLMLIAITNPFLNGFVLYKSIFLGEKDFRGLTLATLPRSIFPTLLVLLSLLLTKNTIVILGAYFLSNLAMGWSLYRYALKKFDIREESDKVKETADYGKHLSVMGTVSQMISSLDQILLWHFAGPFQLAAYSLALTPIREIRSFSENLHPLVFPKYATKTVDEMKRTMPLRTLQIFAVSASVAVLYIVAAPFLFKLVFPQYVSAVFASQLLAAALVLQPKGMVDVMLYAQGDTRLRYVTIFVPQGAKLAFWLGLIPALGMLGAVIGTILAEIVSALTLWWAYRKLK